MLHPFRDTRSPPPVEVGDIGHRVIHSVLNKVKSSCICILTTEGKRNIFTLYLHKKYWKHPLVEPLSPLRI